MTENETKAPKRKRPAKALLAPDLTERVSKLKPLPWNALTEEIIDAHNALLAAIKGDG